MAILAVSHTRSCDSISSACLICSAAHQLRDRTRYPRASRISTIPFLKISYQLKMAFVSEGLSLLEHYHAWSEPSLVALQTSPLALLRRQFMRISASADTVYTKFLSQRRLIITMATLSLNIEAAMPGILLILRVSSHVLRVHWSSAV